MSLFSKIKSSLADWATGNSITYSDEEEIYKEITSLVDNLEEELEKAIMKGTLSDKWAIINFQNNIYTLPLLKALIKETLKKSATGIMSEMNTLLNFAMQLQKLHDKYEEIIKKRVTKIAPYNEEFQEIYYILIELRKVLVSNMHLKAIESCGYHDFAEFPNYGHIIKLKLEIARRRTVILPYLSEIDYNKGR